MAKTVFNCIFEIKIEKNEVIQLCLKKIFSATYYFSKVL
jgi:hypothetical protein